MRRYRISNREINSCQFCNSKEYVHDIELPDGYHKFCKDCIQNFLKSCSDCEISVDPTDSNSYKIIDGKYICKNCLENYAQCADCDTYVIKDKYNITDDDTYVCENCAENNYLNCAYCDRLVKIQKNMHELDGQVCCKQCYKKRKYKTINPETQDNGQIYDYNTKIDVNFKKRYFQETNELIGVELEICAQTTNALDLFIKEAKSNKKIIFTRDRSIGAKGIQIKTQPATYQYHKNVLKWEHLFALMNKYDINYVEGCGIHFHISRKNFTHDQEKTVDYFVNKCHRLLSAIGGRDYTTNQYCKAIPDKENWGQNYEDRYQAVNFTDDTVELRFPQSTASYVQFKRLLRMVHNICKFAKFFTFDEIKELNESGLQALWKEILRLV